MTPISSPWPFAQWGINIMGPFPLRKKQLRFLIVVIDYFIKWVEVEPVATITEAKVTNFVWKTSSGGLESHVSLYQTMESSLTALSFKKFAKT